MFWERHEFGGTIFNPAQHAKAGGEKNSLDNGEGPAQAGQVKWS